MVSSAGVDKEENRRNQAQNKLMRSGPHTDADSLFVHYSNIVQLNAAHLVATLAEEKAVKIDVGKSGDRLEAVNVTGAKRKAVVGNEEAPVRGVEIAPKWAIHFIPAIDQPTRHYGMKKVFKESDVETDGEDAEEKTEWLPKWTDDDIISRGFVGTTEWLQVKGFGFVTRDNVGETTDLCEHRSSPPEPSPKHIIESLADEERIKFDIVKTEKGQEAVNVTDVDGGAVVGSEHAPPLTLSPSVDELDYLAAKPMAHEPCRRRGGALFAEGISNELISGYMSDDSKEMLRAAVTVSSVVPDVIDHEEHMPRNKVSSKAALRRMLKIVAEQRSVFVSMVFTSLSATDPDQHRADAEGLRLVDEIMSEAMKILMFE